MKPDGYMAWRKDPAVKRAVEAFRASVRAQRRADGASDARDSFVMDLDDQQLALYMKETERWREAEARRGRAA